MKIPMPSPNGTNYEKLFVDAPRRGAAYDSKGGLRRPVRRLGYDASPVQLAATSGMDPVHMLASWCIAHLDRDAQQRLCEYLSQQPADAQDDASLDPYDTRAKPPTNASGKTPRPGMDSAYERKMASLEERFPGIGRIGFA
jgi:hypothetical protein